MKGPFLFLLSFFVGVCLFLWFVTAVLKLGVTFSEITSFVIGFGGLAVAVLTMHFADKSRTAAYRHTVFSKQIEAYSNVMALLMSLHEKTRAYILEKGNRLTNKNDGSMLMEAIKDDQHDVIVEVSKSALFISDNFVAHTKDYMNRLKAVAWDQQCKCQFDKAMQSYSERGQLDLFLAEGLAQVVSSARKDIGIEPLMKGTQKTIAEDLS